MPGHEAAVLLQVVGRLLRIEDDRGVEEAEEDDQADIEQQVERLAVAEIGRDPLQPAGLAGAALESRRWSPASSSSEEAKIGGITPEVLILSGRCEALAADTSGCRPGASGTAPGCAAARAP